MYITASGGTAPAQEAGNAIIEREGSHGSNLHRETISKRLSRPACCYFESALQTSGLTLLTRRWSCGVNFRVSFFFGAPISFT